MFFNAKTHYNIKSKSQTKMKKINPSWLLFAYMEKKSKNKSIHESHIKTNNKKYVQLKTNLLASEEESTYVSGPDLHLYVCTLNICVW